MPLLVIRQSFGSSITHSVVMCDDPRPASGLGKTLCSIKISDEVAQLPLRVLARLFPVAVEGDHVFGPDALTARRGLRKAEKRARRQRAEAEALCGAPEGSAGHPEA